MHMEFRTFLFITVTKVACVSALKCVNIFLEKIVTFRLNHVIAVYGEPFTTKVVKLG